MQSKVKLRKLCAQCKAIFCHLSTLRSNFIVYRDTWYINTDTYDMVCFAVLCDSEQLFLCFAVCSHWDDATIYLDKLCNWLCYCFVALAAIIGQTARTDCKLHFGKAATVAFPRITATGNFGWKLPAASATATARGNIMWSTAQLSVLSWRLAVWSSSNNNYRKLTSFHQQQERSFPELPAG